VITLLAKEFTLEFRRTTVVAGIILYLASTVFICYITFSLKQAQITPLVWSALFWLTVLFTAINSVAKSFIGEKKGKDIYLYSLVSPEAIILSKMIYNSLLCLFLSISSFALFAIFIANPIDDTLLFIVTLILSSLAFSGTLTILSGIASRAGNSNVLMAVLSFPVAISVLMLAVKITKNCIDGLDRSVSQSDLITLLAINVVVGASSYLLFPYIWRT
jgi:heme exporter protein B